MAAEDPNISEAPVVGAPEKLASRRRQAKRSSGNGGHAGTRSKSLQGRSASRGGKKSGSTLGGRGKRLVEDAQSWAGEAREAVPRFARNMHLPSPPSLETFTEANPVVLGAVGLGIGVLIGALLPRDVFQTGMHGLGLTAATASSSRSARGSSGRSRSKR